MKLTKVCFLLNLRKKTKDKSFLKYFRSSPTRSLTALIHNSQSENQARKRPILVLSIKLMSSSPMSEVSLAPSSVSCSSWATSPSCHSSLILRIGSSNSKRAKAMTSLSSISLVTSSTFCTRLALSLGFAQAGKILERR